jgi:hypothetical protein
MSRTVRFDLLDLRTILTEYMNGAGFLQDGERIAAIDFRARQKEHRCLPDAAGQATGDLLRFPDKIFGVMVRVRRYGEFKDELKGDGPETEIPGRRMRREKK